MTVEQLHKKVGDLHAREGASLPVKTLVNGAHLYVSVLELRPTGLVLEATTEVDDTSGLLNDLGRQWEHFGSEVFLEIDGKPKPILNAAKETQNWNNVPRWEECVIIDTV
jgi:hypothetical protein